MNHSSPYLNATEAARRLGVSTKALRLYEERGLLRPARSAAGWRAYGGAAMVRAGEIAALRRLGLSLGEVARVLDGDAAMLDEALAAHRASIETRMGELGVSLALVNELRARLASGEVPGPGQIAQAMAGPTGIAISVDLPWPWGGERFEIPRLAGLTYLVGSLGSGKTRLARALAEALPDAVFAGLDRAESLSRVPDDLLGAAEALLIRLVEDGASRSDALLGLCVALVQGESRIVVVDLVEHGLDEATQEAVGDMLRQRGEDVAPMVVMTRSTAILDLAAMGSDAALLLCPANHSPPMLVAPHAGASGYQALQSCLGAPQVRARSQGMRVVMDR